jgi:glycogen synthase
MVVVGWHGGSAIAATHGPQGVDLIRDNYDYLMGEKVQLILLGSGREDLEAALREMEER